MQNIQNIDLKSIKNPIDIFNIYSHEINIKTIDEKYKDSLNFSNDISFYKDISLNKRFSLYDLSDMRENYINNNIIRNDQNNDLYTKDLSYLENSSHVGEITFKFPLNFQNMNSELSFILYQIIIHADYIDFLNKLNNKDHIDLQFKSLDFSSLDSLIFEISYFFVSNDGKLSDLKIKNLKGKKELIKFFEENYINEIIFESNQNKIDPEDINAVKKALKDVFEIFIDEINAEVNKVYYNFFQK